MLMIYFVIFRLPKIPNNSNNLGSSSIYDIAVVSCLNQFIFIYLSVRQRTTMFKLIY